MCCGVVQNAYHTLDSISFVLPDGLAIDTAAPGAAQRFVAEAPGLARGLSRLKATIESNEELTASIRRKYGMKNTTGYSLNAFLDYDEPLEILAHLLIGSEGTLAFIAEAVLNTVPDLPHKSTGLLFYPDVPAACDSIEALRDSGAGALELMDRASLRSIADQPGVPARIRELPPNSAAILVEYQCRSGEELERCGEACRELLPALPLLEQPEFTRDATAQAALWRVRKGIIPTIGAMRRRGTSCILEDVVFPLPRLASGVEQLQALCTEHGYDDVALFGHAKDGNLHFVLTQAFEDPAEVERYDGFMQQLAGLVATRHGGALKAEHGTGRNMAPFVATEWGGDAYAVMQELKRLIDPDRLLNPGVILNDDPRAHVTDLKSLPTVETEVDHCIECGFCERMCPSRDLTLTPRQRIVVRREMARLGLQEPDSPVLTELAADYRYAGLETCATDGLCALTCPVGIDTGQLVKRLRRQAVSPARHELARVAAERLAWIEPLARAGLRLARLVRPDLPPAAAGGLPVTSRAGAAFVYLPSCVSRVVGSEAVEELVTVAQRAGRPAWIPPDAAGHCCGLAFSSKGLDAASRAAAERTVAALRRWTGGGALPVVVDASPCAATLKECAPGGIDVLDPVELAHDLLLPALSPGRLPGGVLVHPTCSLRRMGLEGKLQRVAEACAARAEIPRSAGCCGFAGDRGFTHPELTAAATVAEGAEIAGGDHVGWYSTSRTCEIALSRASGRPFRGLWSLLERVTRPGG
jgi:D-lactate dehydrogenase